MEIMLPLLHTPVIKDHGVVTDHDIEDTLAIPRGQESNLDSIRKSGRMTNKPERYGMNSYDFKTFG